MLHGKDFLLDYEGEKQFHGFFTTRWVKAENPKEAELAAVRLIKEDVRLVNATSNKNGEEPEPMIYLEELSEVSWLTYLRRRPGVGYSFYLKENEES